MPIEPRDADYVARVEAFAAKPYFRQILGMRLEAVAPGAVTVTVDHRPELGHQPGFFQGAFVSAAGEYAASWSAATLLAAGSRVLTLEQSIRFLAPAKGQRLVARGRVVATSRTISTTAADIFALDSGSERLCASLMQTCHLSPPGAAEPGCLIGRAMACRRGDASD